MGYRYEFAPYCTNCRYCEYNKRTTQLSCKQEMFEAFNLNDATPPVADVCFAPIDIREVYIY